MLDLGSERWSEIIREGLGATTARLPGGGMLACFRAGPFRIAYPDFVVGTADYDCNFDLLIDAARELGADLLRLQAPGACADPRTLRVHELGTVVIGDLLAWNERRLEKPRRAANRQSRSDLVLRNGVAADGAQLHALYRSTVQRHGGIARYSERYFELLAPHAAIVAELNGLVCGFVCTGFLGSRGCYMHGAHAPQARSHYPSDQLFLAMLRRAREAGLTSFDFLPTPLEQPSLLAYKFAWGGMPAPLSVSDVALNLWRAHTLDAALRIERILRGWGRPSTRSKRPVH